MTSRVVASTPASSVSIDSWPISATILVGMKVDGCRLFTVTASPSRRSASSMPQVIWASLDWP